MELYAGLDLHSDYSGRRKLFTHYALFTVSSLLRAIGILK